MNAFDLQAALNPIHEFFNRKSDGTAPPDGYSDALAQLHSVGVRLTLPPSRVAALVGCWQRTSTAPGDVVECGSYRGATALLIALLGKMQARQQRVHLFDTFRGSPSATA